MSIKKYHNRKLPIFTKYGRDIEMIIDIKIIQD